ncbi:MAG TPA: hypothetical protein VKB93_11980 [Thermoanaerobaculia bacterium]|nr:hypothetical protein [Thermoanaerobaculia bacterium]
MRTLLTTLLLASTFAVSAQEIENIAGVRMTFDRAGARSLAMGSTGIAANDAELASTNPAAIAGAARSFSIETRRRSFEGRYIVDNQLHSFGIDSSTSGIRGAALTFPMSGLTWSFFYDQPLDVHHSTASIYGPYTTFNFFICEGRPAVTPCNAPQMQFELPITFPVDVRLRLQRYGAATAWSRGPLAVGASIRRDHFRQEAVFLDGFGPLNGIAETVDDTALTWSGGATWSFGSAARIGATYASGGSFAGQRTFSYTPLPAQPLEFRTPPSFGAGISIEPLPQLTIAADVLRVRYSEMMHEQRNVNPARSELGYPDVTELHAGAEYRLGALALRAGWWRDPAHALKTFNGILPPSPLSNVAAILDSSENHLTAGIGVGTKTRFDASIDRSERTTRLGFGVSTKF